MKILLHHPVRLPAKDYGGVERVVLWLARGLLERGHDVWVEAEPGSCLPLGVRLWEVEPKRQRVPSIPSPRVPAGIELVHFMAPPGEAEWNSFPCPRILTVHGNGKPGEIFPLNSVFLSANHASRHGAQVFVHNGIDPDELVYAPENRMDRYLFLSRTGWRVKNLRGAMHLCRRARVGLAIAGGSRPLRLRLRSFATPGFEWLGPVAGNRKARALAAAKALVFPVVWPEPFGLVVIESLMSGTPVLASRKGSLPELVPPEVGALLPPPVTRGAEEEWVEWLARPVLPFRREACREWALSRFRYSHMAAGYENLYKKVIQGESLHATPPVATDWRTQ